MKGIVIAMLAVQAAMFLAAGYSILFTAMTENLRGRPRWSNLAVGLILVSGVSWNIGNRHAGQPGAEILMYGAPLLLGMGIMAALVLIRSRRGLDGPA
jgi:hypothetical protein